jgi:hypothetical protein
MQGIESHARDTDLFAISANQAQWQPGGLTPDLIPIAGAQVTIAAPVLRQGIYEVAYTIRNIPIDVPLYVQALIMPGAFVPAGSGMLALSAVTPSDLPLANVAGPFNLGLGGTVVRGVDFAMTLQPAPR